MLHHAGLRGDSKAAITKGISHQRDHKKIIYTATLTFKKRTKTPCEEYFNTCTLIFSRSS